jgi:predicted alpha/beta-fold hydrolase
LYEGEDFIRIAAAAKAMGCPGKFWFTGYSLGGQLALWAVSLRWGDWEVGRWGDTITPSLEVLGLEEEDIGGAAVICPSLDSKRSLAYLVKQPFGRYMEKAITRNLKKLAWRIYAAHPNSIDPEAIARVNSIWSFDEELVIKPLGFSSVEAYYDASSALQLLPNLQKPTLIIYAEDDPLFDPAIVPDLRLACAANPMIDLLLTRFGGHVGHISSKACQRQAQDPDPWWAWNRILEWLSGSVG